jgi:ferredoxin-NADP reductase
VNQSSKLNPLPQVGHSLLGHPSRLLRRTDQNIGDLQDPIYYVAGPPGMVSGAHQTLVEFAVPEESIRIEHFAGC